MKKSKIFWGLIFIAAAVLVILNQTGILPNNAITLKILACVFLVPLCISGIIRRKYTNIFFPVAILFLMFAKDLGITLKSPWLILLAAALLSIGCHILFPKKIKFINPPGYYTAPTSPPFQNSYFNENTTAERNVFIKNSYSSCNKYITSQNLERVEFQSTFGGAEIYLNNAKALGNVVELCLNIDFSGVNIYIPKNWHVDCDVQSTLSGIEIQSPNSDQLCDVTLHVVGNTNLSGVKIAYL